MTGAADKLKGKADELKGTLKQTIGKATDNPDLRAEGLQDQASAETEQTIGDIKKDIDGDRHNV
jgi:uncharacterized protein YjbJ (UPF0337 family)